MFVDGEICLVYIYYDCFVMGGVVLNGGELMFDKVEEIKILLFLDCCEMGIVNIGEIGIVLVEGEIYILDKGDVLYFGMGFGVVIFVGNGCFYIILVFVYQKFLFKLVIIVDSVEVKLGVIEILNKCIINQFIYLLVIFSCQLIFGYIMLEDGLVWNMMLVYIYDCWMEVYLYWGMDDESCVLYLMGELIEICYLFIVNEEGVILLFWLIYLGVGIGSYIFIWVMVGDNIDYIDMEFI